jgi:transcriptional regulator with XRE-family HTH domain
LESEVSLENILPIVYHFTWEGIAMRTKEAVTRRIRELCRERDITPNALSHIAGVSQATIKSILLGESKNPGCNNIKKLCDGFGITLGEFFSTKGFDALLIDRSEKISQ